MKTEEIFEPTMTVREFYKYTNTPLKIKSGFNGKVLCKRYRPTLHDKKFGGRIIHTIWGEIEIMNGALGNTAKPILVCFVNGDVEYNLFKNEVVKHE